MIITTKELARIRTAAIGDMLGDPGALDKLGPAATVFRLCRELELARKHAVTMSEVAAAAWGGEIPSPKKNLPKDITALGVAVLVTSTIAMKQTNRSRLNWNGWIGRRIGWRQNSMR